MKGWSLACTIARLVGLLLQLCVMRLHYACVCAYRRTLAWYYEVDEYCDIPYTPVNVETYRMRFEEGSDCTIVPLNDRDRRDNDDDDDYDEDSLGDVICLTRYSLLSRPNEEFLYLHFSDDDSHPTADSIREWFACMSTVDESCLRVVSSDVQTLYDIGPIVYRDTTPILRSLMGPNGAHLYWNRTDNRLMRMLSNQKLAALIAHIASDDSDTLPPNTRFETDVVVRNCVNEGEWRLCTLHFLKDATFLLCPRRDA